MFFQKQNFKIIGYLRKQIGLFVVFVLLLTGLFSYTRVGTPEQVHAATSSNLNIQARLYSASGNIVPDGYYNIEFKMYDASGGGSLLWTETWYDSNGVTAGNDNRVRVVNGYMSVQLGTQTSLPSVNWDDDIWISLNVGGTTQTATPTWDGEMSPRIKLTAVPFAQAARNLRSGNTSTASTNSGNISIQTGNATGTTSNSGNVTLDVGTATGTAGTISVGTANTSGITIGRVGVITDIAGNLTVSGSQFTNSGSTLNSAQALGNFATGGSIGSAATTVDVDTAFTINQTTAGQTLSLPTPTDTAAGRLVYVLNIGSVSFTMHGVTIPSGYGQIYVWNGSNWLLGASGGGAAITLQSAYDGGNTITSSDARDLSVTLANSSTDANFLVDIASGSTSEFKIQANGTDVLQIGSAGQLQLDTQGVTGGILLGGDTNIYRSAANTLKTDDDFVVGSNVIISAAGNITQSGATTFSTGTGSVTLNGNTSVSGSNTLTVGTGLTSLGGNLDVTGSAALKRGTDFSATGVTNDANFGDVSLVRLTGASTQTITGIANGRDGEILTIVNAAGQSATISNATGSSAGNQIITGTGANITLTAGGSITLVYDAASPGYWRVVGSAGFSSGNFIQNGTSLQTSANFNIQSTSSGSVGGIIRGASGQTADLLQFLEGTSGATLSRITADGSFVANTYATATTATTSGTGTNTTTVTLSGSAFTNGDVIFIDNAGQDYYTRITSGGGTATLTVSPAVTFETGRTVTKYNTENIGANLTDYSNSNRFFQGYYLGGITVGAGTGTTLSDGNLTTTATTFNLLNSTATTINAFGAASTINLGAAGATVTNPGSLNIRATGTNTLDLDTTGAGTIGLGDTNATTIGIGNSTAATAITIQGGTSSTAVNIQAAASGNINIGTNAVTGKVLNIGSVGSTNNDTTVHIADSSAAIQTVTIGSTSSTSSITLQAGSTGITAKSDSTSALRVQNAAGTSTLLNADTTNMRVSVGGIGTATGQLYVAGRLPTTYTGTQNTGGGSYDVYVQDRYAYVVNQSADTLQIFDVSNPASPVSVSSTATGDAPTYVFVQGRYAYVTTLSTAGSLQIIDVSNPNSPTITSTLSLGGSSARDVYVQGRYAYVANVSSNTMQVVDVSNPASPTVTGSVAATSIQSIYVQGRFAYVARASTLEVFDVSNPASPSSVGSVATGTTAKGIYVQGKYAYLTTTGSDTLEIFNVSNPATPTSTGSVATGGNDDPWSIYVQGRYAYTANQTNNVVQFFDVSNPASPSSIGTVSGGGSASGLYVQGRYAYLASYSGNLRTYDLGGTYTQQLEAGGIETSTLSVLGSANIGGNTSIQGGLTVLDSSNFSGGLSVGSIFDVTGSAAFRKGTDFSTTGTSNNVNFGEVSLIRLTGASAQTITGIANGRDGEILTIVNAASQSATITNNDSGSTATNRIITGTGASITLPAGGSITLIYDSVAGFWRATGSVAFSTGNYIQNATAQQTNANFNIKSASSGSVVAVIQGTTGQTADLFQLKDEDGTNRLSVGANTGFAVRESIGFTSTNAFTVLSGGGATTFGVNTTSPGVYTDATTFSVFNTNATTINAFGAASTINLGAAGATVTNPGSLNIRATGTNTLDLDTTGAGTIGLGDTNATTIGIGNSTAATAITIQGGTSSTAVNIQAAASGNINIGTNAVTGKVLNIGSVGSTNNDTTVHIADSSAAIQTVTIGSTSSTSGTTIQGGSAGVTVKAGGSTGSSTAFRIQNAAGTATYFQVDNSSSGATNIITIGGNNSGEISSWTSTTALPVTNGLSGSSTFSANGFIYLIGGNDNASTHYSTVYYNKVNSNGSLGSAWTASPNALPVGVSRHSTAQYNGYAYVVGGFNGSTLSTIYYAKLNPDGSTGAWAATTSLPAGRNWHNSIAVNGYMYVLGGGSNTTVNYARINSDGTLGSWQTTTALPSAREDATSVVANGYIYLIGGNNSTPQSSVYYARVNSDGTIGAWNTTTAMSEGLYHHNSVVANGYLYVTAGYNGTSHVTTTKYAPLNSDGTIGAWTTAASNLPGTKSGATSVIVNGYIYHLGGGAYAGTSVYYSSTQRIRVGGALDLVGLGAENLNDGETGTGGELTAGNTNIVGSLKVQGQAAFSRNLSVDGNFSAFGDVSLGGSNTGSLKPWASTTGPGVNRSESGYATYNGYVYAVGGGGTTASVYYSKINANGTLGTWATTSSLNTARDQVSAVAVGGYIYAIGGTNAGTLSSVEYARINPDGTLGAWTTTSSLGTGRYRFDVIGVNGYVYAIGGPGTATVEYAKVNANGTLGAWAATSSLTGGSRYGHAAMAANGYMYVIGGHNGSETPTTQYAAINANGTLGTWTATTSMNSARGVVKGTIANGYVYIVGGFLAGALSTVEYAPLNSDGTIGSWTTTSSLGTARYGNGVLVANGYIYSISGNATTTAEYTSTQRIRVGGSLDLIGYGGETLADGGFGSGGSLTAGNTNIVGYLQVAGAANVSSSLAVGQELVVGGSALFKNSSDSTTAFQVQNAAGTNTLLNIDTSGAIVSIANSAVASTVNIGNTTGVTTVNILGGTTGNINIGSVGSSALASTTHIADTNNATGAQAVTIGSSAANTGNITIIQGGSNTTQAIQLTPNTAGGILIGASAGTGTIALGQSTATNTISIGSATPAGSATQTINIGNGSMSNASSSTIVNILSGSAGTNGTASLLMGNNDRVTQIDIGNVAADAARTLNFGTGNNIVGIDTLNIGTGNTTVAGGKTINIGTGTPTGSGTNLITIGSLANASTTTIQGGTGAGGITLSAAGSASTGIMVKNSTNSTAAFQIQNATSQSLFVADTTNQRIAVGPAAVPANGVLTVGTNTTTASGGIFFGTDTNLYRYGNNTLASDNHIASTAGSFYTTAAGAGLIFGASNMSGLVNAGAGGTGDIYLYNGSASPIASFSQTGTALFRNSTNSTVAFQIQSASGSDTMFIADTTTTNKIKIGNSTGTGTSTTIFQLDAAASAPFGTGQTAYLGSMYYDSTQGKLQCYESRNGTAAWGACGSAPNNIITLTPEYTGAVLNGTGVGTLTADFCSNQASVLVVGTLCASGEARNFYKWTSPQGTDQTYGIYVTYKLPSTFSSFSDANTMKLTALTDNTTNANATLQVFRKNVGSGTIVSCGSATTINNAANTWQQTSFGGDETACGFVGGDYVIFKINVTAKSSGNVYVENLDFTYTNQ